MVNNPADIPIIVAFMMSCFLMLVVMMMMSLSLPIWIIPVNYFKVSHHSRSMVLEDMAMVHPYARAVVGIPRVFFILLLGGKLTVSFHALYAGALPCSSMTWKKKPCK